MNTENNMNIVQFTTILDEARRALETELSATDEAAFWDEATKFLCNNLPALADNMLPLLQKLCGTRREFLSAIMLLCKANDELSKSRNEILMRLNVLRKAHNLPYLTMPNPNTGFTSLYEMVSSMKGDLDEEFQLIIL